MDFRNIQRFKVATTSARLTSFAGLSLIAHLFRHFQLSAAIDRLPLKTRNRGYSNSDFVILSALNMIAGGQCLDDLIKLKNDESLVYLLGQRPLPAPNTLGEFLRRFDQRNLLRLDRINHSLVRQLLAKTKPSTMTLDIDASLIESFKQDAQPTYQDFKGYNPILVWIPEVDSFLTAVFRHGNASPRSHLLSLLRKAHKTLKDLNLKFRFRSDSAGYQAALLRYCQRHQIEFTITAMQDSSVLQTIQAIPENDFIPLDQHCHIAETVHPVGSDKNLPAFRLIVKRTLLNQPDIFQGNYAYHAVITNISPEVLPAKEIILWHNQRGCCEKAIGELKNGFGLEKLPCGNFLANAAHLLIGLLAYNITTAYKMFTLPAGWRNFNIKTLRFRLLVQAALVILHAGYLLLKLPQNFPYLEIFQHCRNTLYITGLG